MPKPAILLVRHTLLTMALGILLACQSPRSPQQDKSRLERRSTPPLPKAPLVYPKIDLQQPKGAPAMHPVHPDRVPAFTADEVRQFLTSTPGPIGIQGEPGVTISRVDCSVTAKDVSVILHGKSTGLPADVPLCYVELAGTFTFSSPPTRTSPHLKAVTFNTGFRVFDAKTGNIMLTGAFKRSSSNR